MNSRQRRKWQKNEYAQCGHLKNEEYMDETYFLCKLKHRYVYDECHNCKHFTMSKWNMKCAHNTTKFGKRLFDKQKFKVDFEKLLLRIDLL